MHHKPKAWKMGLWIILLLPLLVQCTKGNKKSFNKEAKEPGEDYLTSSSVPVIEQYIVKSEQITDLYKTTSLISSVRDVELYLLAGQRVAKVFKQTGEYAKKGELIATLSDPTIDVEEKQAFIAFQEAKRQHQDDEVLYKNQHISKDKFEKSKHQMQKAFLNLQSIRKKMQNLKIEAPFSGTIARNDLQIGAFVKSFGSKAPIRMIQLHQLKGKFALPSSYFTFVKQGHKLNIKSRGISKKAKVTRVEPVIDPDTGTFEVYYQIKNKDLKLIPGEKVELAVPIGTPKQLLILPEDTLVYEGSQPYVYYIDSPSDSEINADLEEIRKKLETLESDKRILVPFSEVEQLSKEKESKELADDQKYLTRDTTIEQLKSNPHLNNLLKNRLRARRIAVSVNQLPNGMYSLEKQLDLRQSDMRIFVGEGSRLAKIGLRQISDGSKVQVIEGL